MHHAVKRTAPDHQWKTVVFRRVSKYGWVLGKTGILAARMMPKNKTAAEGLGRSCRHHLHRFRRVGCLAVTTFRSGYLLLAAEASAAAGGFESSCGGRKFSIAQTSALIVPFAESAT